MIKIPIGLDRRALAEFFGEFARRLGFAAWFTLVIRTILRLPLGFRDGAKIAARIAERGVEINKAARVGIELGVLL